MWQPFHTRFHDILKRMKSCQKIVQKELDLVLLQQLESQVREGADRVTERMEDINKIYEEVLEIKSSFDEAAKGTWYHAQSLCIYQSACQLLNEEFFREVRPEA